MTVAELIALLQEQPGDLPVYVYIDDFGSRGFDDVLDVVQISSRRTSAELEDPFGFNAPRRVLDDGSVTSGEYPKEPITPGVLLKSKKGLP
jgi:hypothetical protein